ncbi:Peptidase propeptide and YPEB domain protein [Pigmentiphaga humi]|uniref:Peptidase propeptide and YPEB domain protein n=1 Tax=Pigmentiphaga humi TaxID=2478468 RepID=A0A3P4B447_9BURK|nr:PepSY domain-containing protein [Pigmentiphaga humi]VCU71074.1 Peptidase propeptide and YPEB domain protein [Pigmentiphaga humi]
MHTPYFSDRPAAARSAAYRTLWRWHFYAALFVMPFLTVLAVTGTLYCFQPQIDPLLYPGRLLVAPATTPRLSEDDLLARAEAAVPPGSRPAAAAVGSDPERSAEFVFRYPDGRQHSVYLNPYTGEMLGTLSVEQRFMQRVRMIHRKLLLGKPGELLMELAACWTLVMVGTGIALWWPRGALTWRGTLWPRLDWRGRAFWKSVHAVMGIWLAAGAVAFILTGLPWSGSWGEQFKSLATRANLGSPPGVWGGSTRQSTIPGRQLARPANHAQHGDAVAGGRGMDGMPPMVMDDLPLPSTPWAVGATTVPGSGPAGGSAAALPLDRILDIVRANGIPRGYDVAFPSTPSGVYTVSYFPPDPKREHVLHIDQYSGEVLEEIGYDDYGAVSRLVSYGTSLHMGRYFGLANQLVCALISLGLAGMAITGFVMWWKRRPQKALGAPARLPTPVTMRRWKIGLAALGMVFPLMGGTMLLVWALDSLALKRRAMR